MFSYVESESEMSILRNDDVARSSSPAALCFVNQNVVGGKIHLRTVLVIT